MKHVVRIGLVASLLFATGAAIAATDTPAGTWKQVDDASGKIKSVVQITDNNGEYQAKVLKLENRTPEDIARDGADPVCVKCDGKRKNQPIVGMTIMWGVSKDDDVWDGGKIVDPKSGKIYKVKLSTEDGGQKLKVRAYVGFALLGRTQTWIRVE